MSDEKYRPLGGLSTKSDGIPIPVANVRSQPQSKYRLRRMLLVSGALLASYFYVNGLSQFTPFYAGHVSYHTHHKHRHGRVLTGKAAEKAFLKVPSEESCIEASSEYTKQPHIAGSEGDLDTAKDFLSHLQHELGIKPPDETPIFPAGSPESQDAILSIPKTREPKAWIDTYYPVMNTPLDRNLQALDGDGNVIWEADLTEHADDTDATAGKYADAVPTFHGLSRGGDVSGKLIYANYGLKEDYDALLEKGTNFTGAIVLTRYGGNFRGLKVKGAQELGAAGVLIYTDYRDDGAVTTENGYEVYPNGPARNPTSVQRGSVQFLSMYPGDPTTPGYPSYENSTRSEGKNIPAIPSLPISAENAGKLKELLDSGNWTGVVRLNNQVDTRVIPIWNTMAVIPGYIKDEVVVMGNHRDAWVLGGSDPSSGTASISETIRGFGTLLRNGWKPLRTIVIASWDAEEYGLIGSTEWGEDFEEFIDKYVVAYLNLDGSVSGSRFSAQASPLLAHTVQKAALDIPHPTKDGLSLWDATQDTGELFGNTTDGQILTVDSEALEVYNGQYANLDELGVGVLGSGSDYTVFLQRIGVASMSHGFGRTMNDPVYHYHSIYDSQRWEELYADPGFFRHVAVAKHLGLVTLRLTDSIVLPLNTTHYSFELEKYLDKVEDLVSAQAISVDLTPLRDSIHSLQAASLALDYEKLVAERELVNILKSWKKKISKWKKLQKKLKKAYCKWQKKVFGRECKKHHHGKQAVGMEDFVHVEQPMVNLPDLSSGGKPRIGRLPAWTQEQRDQDDRDVLHGFALRAGVEDFARRRGHHGCARDSSESAVHPHLPFAKFRAAVKRVRNVNKKLVSFERGLISKDGIPAREWFKHLGVAPGKWLGYGATTLPALTESITFEKNATLAKYEMERLKELVDGITENLRI